MQSEKLKSTQSKKYNLNLKTLQVYHPLVLLILLKIKTSFEFKPTIKQHPTKFYIKILMAMPILKSQPMPPQLKDISRSQSLEYPFFKDNSDWKFHPFRRTITT